MEPNHTSDCGSFASAISDEWQQQQCESSERQDGTTSLSGSHPPANCFHRSCSPLSPASLPSPLPANHPPARGRDKEEVSSREDMLHAHTRTHTRQRRTKASPAAPILSENITADDARQFHSFNSDHPAHPAGTHRLVSQHTPMVNTHTKTQEWVMTAGLESDL